MSLKEQLDSMRGQAESFLPPEALSTLHKQIDDWRDSGVSERILKVGDVAPEFALFNVEGNILGSKALLEKGPIVLHFFRGKW